uniref:Ubiquitin-like domain-containing protein n=1 Tax=Chromera velia CCMP2878 TaxID=1169474 RepID=A0A0G4GYF7_9ALVE|mmetsp:Transcript_28890/g.56560  ORF Transcript_28890/g.56560 Transcript_28890/m.56560 type:complete len:118 (+) Transcript_28890:326-679(+)|eukprot:Cvel_23905.t1-p1 / transcript=Cvel_23905.t1 / gene=Cvel_23905 / organism=Chromera_velia_CCMP2878 / gene_product=hypothetical protein / transcript_product=hypothetical protein / location=Cvel_scaffold2521:6399-7653(-) / protein_length=117 / sequence_SO=supercontig / SO=protein_coding / is_pseudo=false
MLDPLDSIHIKVKRKHRTMFLLCYPDETVGTIRDKISAMTGRDGAQFRLLHGKLTLTDEVTVKAAKLQNGDVVHLVYKIEGKEEFEQPDVTSLQPATVTDGSAQTMLGGTLDQTAPK